MGCCLCGCIGILFTTHYTHTLRSIFEQCNDLFANNTLRMHHAEHITCNAIQSPEPPPPNHPPPPPPHCTIPNPGLARRSFLRFNSFNLHTPLILNQIRPIPPRIKPMKRRRQLTRFRLHSLTLSRISLPGSPNPRVALISSSSIVRNSMRGVCSDEPIIYRASFAFHFIAG